MRAVFGLVLVVGVGLAGFAVYMAKNFIGDYQTQLAQAKGNDVPTRKIYVAARTLKYGEEIKEEDLKIVRYPEEALPEGVFDSKESMFPDGPRSLRVALRQMEPLEPVLAVKVTEPGQDAGITSQLERGMRAFAIKVDVTSGVSGFLRPGDRVDVYWTGRVNTQQLGTEGVTGDFTKMIEPSVKIIAVDQKSDSRITEAQIARTVTVAVRPNQVAALAQAQQTGRLSLSLVGSTDDTLAQVIEVDQRRLLGLQTAQAPEVLKEKKRCTIRTRRGGEVVEMPIPCTN